MSFVTKPVKFTLKDIGSEILDQLSTDIYTGPDAIMRELIKNAYDAYVELDRDGFDETAQRQIVVSRERDDKGHGILIIADEGIGQSLESLKANVQISISHKPQDLENATGFRGLGSWAILGAGSLITVASSRRGVAHEYRLTIDVREVYRRLSPDATLDDILNDSKCISFEQGPRADQDHFTTVEVRCDAPPEFVNGHELNRLYKYTEPDEPLLRDLLVKSCPIPFCAEGVTHEQIHEVYRRVGYVPTSVVLDGATLERRLPAALSRFQQRDLDIGGKTVAIAWVVDNPTKTGEISSEIDEGKSLLGGPSIQLAKLNVPIGPKGLFAENVRSGILDWYVGEVQIIAPDVLPDAGGHTLRAGTPREAFVTKLQEFYKSLDERAEAKSDQISILRKMRQAKDAVKRLQGHKISAADRAQEEAKIARAVEVIEETTRRSKPKTAADRKLREAARQGTVMEAVREARKDLKQANYFEKYARETKKTKSKNNANGDARARSSANGGAAAERSLSLADFQARVGRVLPKFSDIGLNPRQIESVLQIIRELFVA